MVRKKTGPTDVEDVTPKGETTEGLSAPRTEHDATDPVETPRSPEQTAPAPAPTLVDPEDAALLAAVEDAVEAAPMADAEADTEADTEKSEGERAEGEYNIFADAKTSRAAPETAPDAEDAVLLDAVDDAVARAEEAPVLAEAGTGEAESPFARDAEPEARPEARYEPKPEPVPETVPETVVVEEGGSLASKVLTGLVLLLVGAGVGIWAAPKVAPALPAGMKPVADWLQPAEGLTETEIAELRTQLEGQIAALRGQVGDLSPAELDTRIGAAVGAAETKLRDEISQVDGTDTRQRLARLEAGLEGQVAQLGTLKSQIGDGPVAGGSAGVDVYRAELDGMRAEIGALSDKVGGLGSRVDAAASAADRQIATAQAKVTEIQTQAAATVDAAAVAADLALVQAALAEGHPFAEPLDRLSAAGMTVPEGLTAAAGSGISSMAQLRDAFPDAAHAAIRANIIASAGDGLLERTRAMIEAQIATRSLTPREGTSPDAVLSRVEEKLRKDDLPGALSEAGQLPSEAAAAIGGWLDAAKLRAGAEAGLATLTAEISAKN